MSGRDFGKCDMIETEVSVRYEHRPKFRRCSANISRRNLSFWNATPRHWAAWCLTFRDSMMILFSKLKILKYLLVIYIVFRINS